MSGHGELALHDAQIRGTIGDRLPRTWTASWDGPVLRVDTPHRGLAFARDLDEVTDGDLAALVERTRDHFAERGESVEWKTYGHDRPDLVERLEAAGFHAERRGTVVIGLADDLVTAGTPAEGITIRRVFAYDDLVALAALHAGEPWLADDLRDRIESSPGHLVVLVAEAHGQVVAGAWLVIVPGTEFASLWGGATLPEWRRRGIYRALVAERAAIAVARGVKYLLVDATQETGPVLRRLGLHAVSTTTPYLFTPSRPGAPTVVSIACREHRLP